MSSLDNSIVEGSLKDVTLYVATHVLPYTGMILALSSYESNDVDSNHRSILFDGKSSNLRSLLALLISFDIECLEHVFDLPPTWEFSVLRNSDFIDGYTIEFISETDHSQRCMRKQQEMGNTLCNDEEECKKYPRCDFPEWNLSDSQARKIADIDGVSISD